MQLRVKKTELIADDIRLFELESPDGKPLAPQMPGAHMDVTGPTGVTRQYSLCQRPGETRFYRIAVKREPQSRGGSASMHDGVAENDLLEVSTPRNAFHWQGDAPGSVLIAGGIGITPILPMAFSAVRTGKDHRLFYFARSAQHAVFHQEIAETLGSENFAIELGLQAEETVDRIDEIIKSAPADWHIYACGPGPMLDCVRATAEAHGATDRLSIESFSAAPVSADSEEFEVELARSGHVITIGADQTILDALLDNGIDIEFSCEQGVCGTCIQRVLAGKPDHKDEYLTDAEHAAGDQIAVCISRAKSSRIVLDL